MIKRILSASTLILVGIFGLVLSANAEKISSFDISAEIVKDGTVNVAENIQYDFEGAERHGIFRDIPLVSKDGPDIAIEVVGVSDEVGSVPFTTSKKGNNFSIKIGDADKLVSGVKNYRIDYQVFGSVRYFNDYDEFYWNVNGNDWQIPIVRASAKIFADFNFLGSTSTSCYTGPINSVAQDCSFIVANNFRSIFFSTTDSLSAESGLTVAVSFPKGAVNQIAAEKNYSDKKPSEVATAISGVVFFALFGLFFVFISYLIIVNSKKLISDKRLRGKPIVVQYNQPESISLADMAMIGHRNFRAGDISAEIINLAVNGYIKIIYPQKTLFSKDNYELTKLKDEGGIKDAAGKEIFNYLFAGDRVSVKIKDLDKAEGSELLKNLNDSTKEGLVKRGLLKDSWMIKLSDSGVDILWHIFGFAKFLEATEKDKLELMNAPELKPEIFEKFLPHAMVLGLEKKWASKFESIFTAPPSWVEGYPTNQPFNAIIFVNSMNSFSSSVVRSSTYSSGSGGGGSSGGGSGGGGGGSW